MEKTAKELKISIDHHMVYPRKQGVGPCYCFVLFIDQAQSLDLEQLRQRLDLNLMHFNDDYKDCRDDRIIFPPQVQTVSSHYLKDFFAKNKHRGQFKMKTAFPTQSSFEAYFQENFTLDLPAFPSLPHLTTPPSFSVATAGSHILE